MISLAREWNILYMWYCYDFTDILKLYVVKTDFWIMEYYLINKTTLRKYLNSCLAWKIYYIKEV